MVLNRVLVGDPTAAEATEAFFCRNDFYPFIRTELRKHDPEKYKLLEKLWGLN